ncbi:MAG: hypothetical protein ABFR02_04030 [Campylobacterota bacterium]
MIQTIEQIFATGTEEQIVDVLQVALKTSSESPMWTEKAIPLTEAILSVLIPLREQNLLVTPEGAEASALTPDLFLRYCDLANLKWLAFTLQQSNDTSTLQRSKYSREQAAKYEVMDLSTLGSYLSGYTVNLEDEWLDFPIANYNLHIGVSDLIGKLLK